ncbi:MAG: hypothetical protein N2422_08340 [Rhodobacteraceae bacterium]|nr:hypothetical protein [Paracoccaceae bacterium]
MVLRLTGRPAVISGGGEAAAKKAPLKQRTQVQLVLAIREAVPGPAAPLATGCAEQAAGLPARLFRDAALVVVAAGCPGPEGIARDAAHAPGAMVGVADRPGPCDALAPAIVDRGAVVVAIRNEGPAPVLARRIRSRIGTSLQSWLGARSPHAGGLRPEANRSLPWNGRRIVRARVFGGPPRQALARAKSVEGRRPIGRAMAVGGAGAMQSGLARADAGEPGPGHDA